MSTKEGTCLAWVTLQVYLVLFWTKKQLKNFPSVFWGRLSRYLDVLQETHMGTGQRFLRCPFVKWRLVRKHWNVLQHQRCGFFTPLSTASGSAALVARTLCHTALHNFTRRLINHRAPTASKAGAIGTAHIGAPSNPARWLFISLWQMVWQKVQEIRRWTALIASVRLQSLHRLRLCSEAQGLYSRKDFENAQVTSVLHT